MALAMFNQFYKNKKVLVTGHTGFKGSWLTHWLCEMGAEVVGFSLDVPTTPSHFLHLGLDQRIKDLRGDIRDAKLFSDVLATEKPDILFHLAAKAIVRECMENPKEAFLTNTLGTIHVLEALRATPSLQAAVLITSDKCYENVEWDYGYREIDRLGGKDPYSASKAAAEIAFRAYYESYLKSTLPAVATVRAGNVIGGGDWARDRIVPDCMRSWSEKKPVLLRNPQSTRPWQHVLEPLSGYLALAQQLAQKNKDCLGESFNFGPKETVVQPVSELIAALSSEWEFNRFEAAPHWQEAAKGEARLLKLSCDKALARLKWRPVLDFHETAQMTSHWYAEYYNQPNKAAKLSSDNIDSYCRLASERNLPWVTA